MQGAQELLAYTQGEGNRMLKNEEKVDIFNSSNMMRKIDKEKTTVRITTVYQFTEKRKCAKMRKAKVGYVIIAKVC